MRIHTVFDEDLEYLRAVVREVLGAYDGRGIDWVHPEGANLWKINSGQRAGVVGVEVDGRRCCVKLFYDDRSWVKFRNLVGHSKGGRAFRNALKLKNLGMGCPDMIGLVCMKPSGPIIVVSELCDYAQRTDHYISEYGINANLVKSFAVFVRDMHRQGISHVDFSLRNTMVVAADDEPCYRFILLDHEDARFQLKLSVNQRMANLYHLLERALTLVPLKWRVVFLREYLQTSSVREWVDGLNALMAKYPSKYTQKISG